MLHNVQFYLKHSSCNYYLLTWQAVIFQLQLQLFPMYSSLCKPR